MNSVLVVVASQLRPSSGSISSGTSCSDDKDDKDAFQYAKKMEYMAVADKHKHAYKEHVGVIVNASAMSLTYGLAGADEWIDASNRRHFPSWEDVVPYSGLEMVFHVYIKQRGCNVVAYGSNRGRAVVILLRWFISYKLNLLKTEIYAVQSVSDVGKSTVRWIAAFSADMSTTFRYVDEAMSHVEGIRIMYRGGPAVVRKQKKRTTWQHCQEACVIGERLFGTCLRVSCNRCTPCELS